MEKGRVHPQVLYDLEQDCRNFSLMKILSADKIEIRIEKQKNNKNFTWCIYCKIEKKRDQNYINGKSKRFPFLLFQQNKII